MVLSAHGINIDIAPVREWPPPFIISPSCFARVGHGGSAPTNLTATRIGRASLLIFTSPTLGVFPKVVFSKLWQARYTKILFG